MVQQRGGLLSQRLTRKTVELGYFGCVEKKSCLNWFFRNRVNLGKWAKFRTRDNYPWCVLIRWPKLLTPSNILRNSQGKFAKSTTTCDRWNIGIQQARNRTLIRNKGYHCDVMHNKKPFPICDAQNHTQSATESRLLFPIFFYLIE